MDFNINNETFANAYKCLSDANVLLESGLGNFSDLDASALGLIGKNGISNADRLSNSNKHCFELKDKMYRTIEALSEINVESADYFRDYFNSYNIDLDFFNPNTQPKNNTLIAHRGYHPGGIWENSREAFIAAGESGFWGAEADVVYDSNGNLVVSHGTEHINSKTISIDEYLDICKEYGMTAIIDLKYDSNTNSDAYKSLGPEVAKIIEEKGMTDSCVIQTNHDNDISNIRASSDDVRIWMLGYNDVTDDQINIALENNVECINFNHKNETMTERNLKKINEAELDACVWNVWSEERKNTCYEDGAKYVMSDKSLGISPYQEGDVDYNSVLDYKKYSSKPVVSLSTDPITTFNDTTKDVTESSNAKPSVDIKPVTMNPNGGNTIFDSSVDAVTTSTDAVNVADANLRNSNVNPNSSDVPLIYQSDYTNVNYGTGTVASHGCGIASLSMVASYYNDTDIMPDELAKKYRGYGSKSGTDHGIYEKTAEELNLPFREQLHYCNKDDLDKVVNSLKEGCVVVAKAKSNSVFTDSGHYIVLTGVSDDGKIYVNDPNKYNYNNKYLADGYANGFDQEKFMYGKVADFFIYSPKSS